MDRSGEQRLDDFVCHRIPSKRERPRIVERHVAQQRSQTRGMGDPVGPGPLGAAFADSLRSKLAGRSVGVYGVNYPADVNFLRVSDGVADATNHIQWLAANCPATKVVLGGFSEGAAVDPGFPNFATSSAYSRGFRNVALGQANLSGACVNPAGLSSVM